MTTALQMFKAYKNRWKAIVIPLPQAWHTLGTPILVECMKTVCKTILEHNISCIFLALGDLCPLLFSTHPLPVPTQSHHRPIPHSVPSSTSLSPLWLCKRDWALQTLPGFPGVQVGWCRLDFSFCLVSASPRFHCIHHTALPCLSSISVVSTNHSEFQAGKDWDFSD